MDISKNKISLFLHKPNKIFFLIILYSNLLNLYDVTQKINFSRKVPYMRFSVDEKIFPTPIFAHTNFFSLTNLFFLIILLDVLQKMNFSRKVPYMRFLVDEKIFPTPIFAHTNFFPQQKKIQTNLLESY
jgi:hypothetical protein